MKKIAIIAPCILPVPASKGGAVEELITFIINQNEISPKYAIDLFTIADDSYSQTRYSYTNVIPINNSAFSANLNRVCDKYYRTVKNKSAKRVFDKEIISIFLNHVHKMSESYYAVIIENQMSLAVELLKEIGYSRDYPIYFHMHNDVDIYRSPEYIRTLTENGVQFISISNYITSQIKKYSPDAVVHLLYNGISLDDYSMTTRVNDGKIRFLYAGRVIPTKGVMELVQAYLKMHEHIAPEYAAKTELEIIGFSDNCTQYEKKIYELAKKNSDIIKCQKRLSTAEMAKKYNEFDVVVMPTIDEEPFGLVALETIAKGMALITTNSGAIPEVVGEGAVIVDKNSDFISNLAMQMEKLAVDSDYRNELGKKAYSMARRVIAFNIDNYYYRLVNILDTKCSQNTISVIVPVYNVQDQLKKCVNSLINQSYTNLEIILVDDGSTDNSGLMCDELAGLDQRIRVIHQNNGGLSAARNSGLDIATGEYIFFVDSDDYLDLSTLEKLMNHMSRCNADVVACGFAYTYDEKPESPFTNPSPGIWSGKEAVIQMMTNNNLCTTAWNKLYKACLWKDVRFPKGRVHEDEATTYKVLYASNTVAYLPECLYKYYQRENTIMKGNLEKRYKDYLMAIEERIQYFAGCGEQRLVDDSILVLLEYTKYVYRSLQSKEQDCLKYQYNKYIKEYGIPKSIRAKKKIALLVWKYVKA